MLLKEELNVNSKAIKKIISTEHDNHFEITFSFTKEKTAFLTRLFETKISCSDLAFTFEKTKENFSISFEKEEGLHNCIIYIQILLKDFDHKNKIANFISKLEESDIAISGNNSQPKSGYQQLAGDTQSSSRLTCPNPFKKWPPNFSS